MGLILQHIEKRVGKEYHLTDINCQFEGGSRNVLLGRTLAGKTSILRIMAGLDRPTGGKLIIDGQDMTGLSVRKRSVAMVYQQFVNYPSLTIYNNIASPLKLAGMDKGEIDRRVRSTAEMLHLETLLDRLPAELSGGQQQRTAIARALVKETQLLLLDEPLVNLDYKLREELRTELQLIFKERQSIVVYTTTEPTEALMLGGNVVVIDEGRILQTGRTAEVYHTPATFKVAEVFSDPPINRIDGYNDQQTIKVGDALQIPLMGHLQGLPAGEVVIGIRSNHLFSAPHNENDLEFKARVELSEIDGSETFTHINFNDSGLVVQEIGIHAYKIGTEISVFLNPSHVFIYSLAGELLAAPTFKYGQ